MSFIELGVGFNPELTGRENVYMNGAMLGFSTAEIDAMYDDIVDFAELHEFMRGLEYMSKSYSYFNKNSWSYRQLTLDVNT